MHRVTRRMSNADAQNPRTGCAAMAFFSREISSSYRGTTGHKDTLTHDRAAFAHHCAAVPPVKPVERRGRDEPGHAGTRAQI